MNNGSAGRENEFPGHPPVPGDLGTAASFAFWMSVLDDEDEDEDE